MSCIIHNGVCIGQDGKPTEQITKAHLARTDLFITLIFSFVTVAMCFYNDYNVFLLNSYSVSVIRLIDNFYRTSGFSKSLNVLNIFTSR